MYCNKCGYKLDPEDLFCVKCGNKVDNNIETDSDNEKFTSSKVKKIILGIVCFIAIGAIAGGIFWAINSKHSDVPASQPIKVEEEFNKEELMQQAKECVAYLNSCEDYFYGAEMEVEMGESKIYYFTYDDEPVSEYRDDTLCYTKIVNFRTVEDVENYARNYMTDDVLKNLTYFDEIPFMEYNGYLYKYTDTSFDCWYDEDSITYKDAKDGKHYIAVDYYNWDECLATVILEFEKVNGGWIVTDFDNYDIISM